MERDFLSERAASENWFGYYARHFNTLEINNTFYRFPQLKNLQSWHQRSPEGFLFSIKVPGAITHYKQFNDTEGLLKDFYSVAREGLSGKLGPLLFQLPPTRSYSEEKSDSILRQADQSFLNVIEFRNDSWWREHVMSRLTENNIMFCGVSFPGLPDDAIINKETGYYRFHGVPKLFHSSYDHAFLQKIIKQIRLKKSLKKAFIYFNNTASPAALENARFVQELVKK